MKEALAVIAGALMVLMTGCATATPAPAGAEESMTSSWEETEAVRSVVVGVVHHIDAKRWPELRALYADEVVTDYVSLFGGTPQKQAGDALIASWQGVLAKVKTQHLLGPIEVKVEGAKAEARCHVRALHYAPEAPSGAEWEVLGHYVFELGRQGSSWKIVAMKLETLLQTGNTKLLAEAAK